MAKTILTEEVKYHKYIVKEFDINIPGQEPIKVKPMQISEMLIEKDYDLDHFPIFRVTLHLQPNVLKLVLSKKEQTTFRIRLQKKIVSTDTSVNIPAKDVFNKNFSIFVNDNTPFFDEKEFKSSHGNTNKIEINNHNPKDFAIGTDFFLFSEKELNASKKIINMVFVTINMTDTVLWSFGEAGIGNLLMGVFDNNNSYSQLLLPALNLIDTINFLEEVYGLYNDGAMLYFDLDRNYLIPRNTNCDVWAGGEYKEVILLHKTRGNETILSAGSLDYGKEKKYLVNILPDNINIYNKSVDSDQVIGHNMKVIDSRNDSVDNISSSAMKRGSGNARYMTNKYGNPFTAKAYKRLLDSGNTHIAVNISHTDIDIFKPNKMFKFIFENSKIASKYSGAYQLSKIVHSFRRDTGVDFTVDTMASFKS